MRISLGGGISITATERWFTEIRAGRAFHGGATQGPVAGVAHHLQLFNPVGSGKTLIIYRWKVAQGATGPYHLRQKAAPGLATFIRPGFNFLIGAANGVGEIRSESNAVLQGGLDTELTIPTGISLTEIQQVWGFEIPAGQGIIGVPNALNVLNTAYWEWLEL